MWLQGPSAAGTTSTVSTCYTCLSHLINQHAFTVYVGNNNNNRIIMEPWSTLHRLTKFITTSLQHINDNTCRLQFVDLDRGVT